MITQRISRSPVSGCSGGYSLPPDSDFRCIFLKNKTNHTQTTREGFVERQQFESPTQHQQSHKVLRIIGDRSLLVLSVIHSLRFVLRRSYDSSTSIIPFRQGQRDCCTSPHVTNLSVETAVVDSRKKEALRKSRAMKMLFLLTYVFCCHTIYKY